MTGRHPRGIFQVPAKGAGPGKRDRGHAIFVQRCSRLRSCVEVRGWAGRTEADRNGDTDGAMSRDGIRRSASAGEGARGGCISGPSCAPGLGRRTGHAGLARRPPLTAINAAACRVPQHGRSFSWRTWQCRARGWIASMPRRTRPANCATAATGPMRPSRTNHRQMAEPTGETGTLQCYHSFCPRIGMLTRRPGSPVRPDRRRSTGLKRNEHGQRHE